MMPKAADKRRATVRDVAAAAGVSTATVSRWLNESISLPAGTIERIRQAIDALGYKPNLHARRLSLGRTDTLALVVPDIADPFFAALAGSVEAEADARGRGVMLCATLNRPSREIDYLDRLNRNHVDGLLFATNHPDDGALRACIEKQPGVVLLDEDVAGVRAPKVFCENEIGGHLATSHLIGAGHRRIGFIGGAAGVMSAVERSEGYARALREAGVSVDPALLSFGGYTAEHGRQAAGRFLALDRRPTAIFASSDQIAIGVLDALRANDLRVPADISIVAYDDVAPFSHFGPPLTAVRQPIARMGARAVEILMTHLSDPAGEPAVERLPVEFMQRESVAPPAHDVFTSRQITTGRTGK